jgi:NAD(P)-dependent dehydrogenase (short-subunit alcohol dehydrogenase family)
MNKRTILSVGTVLAAGACGVALGMKLWRERFSFRDRCVLITGGSRGLGLVMARQLAREGARLVILGRSADSLQRATMELSGLTTHVLGLPCDIRRPEEVKAAFEKAVGRFGSVDVLINNAGIIKVGPLEHMTVEDFEDALATHLFGPLYCSLAALPGMLSAREGRIVNIASIGGKIAVPHLLPYSVSKFALVGLSDGLRAELRRRNILVTTVCPGLMRTGSPRNATFRGQHQREYAWFAVSDALPIVSMDAERAATQILDACRRGSARLVLGVHTKAAMLFNELFPGTMTTALSVANRVLPGPAAQGFGETRTGAESESSLTPSWLTRLSDQAAARNNQLAA